MSIQEQIKISEQTTEQNILNLHLLQLCEAARNLTGLNILLLFGQEPMTCDTAHGFARQLQKPVDEVRDALNSLTASGVLKQSSRLDDPYHISYWLSEDGTMFSTLSDLLNLWGEGPEPRRWLYRAINVPQ